MGYFVVLIFLGSLIGVFTAFFAKFFFDLSITDAVILVILITSATAYSIEYDSNGEENVTILRILSSISLLTFSILTVKLAVRLLRNYISKDHLMFIITFSSIAAIICGLPLFLIHKFYTAMGSTMWSHPASFIFAGMLIIATLIVVTTTINELKLSTGGFDKPATSETEPELLVCVLHADVHFSRITKQAGKYLLEQGSYLGEPFEEIYDIKHEIKFSDALDRIQSAYEWYAEIGYTGPKEDLDLVIDRLNS